MCGIAGYVNLNGEPASSVVVQRMTDVIKHRGPDGEGQFVEESVGLGHRRLAIIDLSPAGHQPMISADHRYVLSYNGEIYNFQILRLELEAKGYWFRSRTDSEVVLYAFAEWGPACVEKFNGMFAFSVWDRKEKILHLIRDRYGIKPLYYALYKNVFIFGSEQKAILEHEAVQKKIDHKALLEYFTFQNIFTDRTLIEGIKLLPAAGRCQIDLKTGKFSIEKYWDYRFREPEGKVDQREYEEELDRLLQQAVNRQLVTDVELGSYLSGGMDSGTLTALAAKKLPYIKTFTCGFDLSSASGIELSFDERAKAEGMSAKFKTEHYEMVLKAGDMERCLPKLAWHLEEPRVGQSYPNYYAALLASKFVKVTLSGTGGDELFAGYPWRYYRAVNCQNFDEYIQHYYLYWQRLVNNKQIRKIFNPVWDHVDDVWTQDIFYNVYANHDKELNRPEDYINHSLYLEAKTFLHGLFVVEDKLSMAHSLENRVPFMDNDLVDFAMRCPVNMKLNNLSEIVRINENEIGKKKKNLFTKTNDGKQILRDVMSNYIPKDISQSVKQGFSSPDASWFKGESIDFVRKTLSDKNARIFNYLDFEEVNNLVNEHINGKINRRLLIWSLLNVENWIKAYLD